MSEQKTELAAKNQYAKFELAISGNEELKQVFGAISEIVEDATFSIDHEGLSFKGMDPSHVCLIDVAIPNMCFEKYEVSTPGLMAVQVKEILKTIKALNKKDTVRLSVNDECILNLSTKYNKTQLRMIEPSTVDTPLPKIRYDTKIGMMFNDLKKALKQIEVVSEYVTFESMPQGFKISGRGDSGSNEIIFEKGMEEIPEIDVRENSKSTYALEYLLPFLKHLNPGTIVLEYSEKMPIRLEVKLANVGRIHFYLAPKVEN